jgi:hypothetical protein
MNVSKLFVTGIIAAVAAFGSHYKAESAGAPPSDVPAAVSGVLQKEGTKVVGPDGTVSEIWLVSTAPKGAASGEQNVTLANVPHGALIGVIRFTSQGKDRRGQMLKPGIYTMRYSMFPIDGAHQGVAPQRDFVVLLPIGNDQDPKAAFSYPDLMKAGEKASGTTHPAVLSIWKADDDNQNLEEVGEDWVLQRKMGDVNLAIVVVGTAAA